MPLGDAAGEVVGGLLRFVARILFEVVFELLIKGTGYLVIKVFKPKSEPDDMACAWVGLGFWAALSGLVWFLYRHVAAA